MFPRLIIPLTSACRGYLIVFPIGIIKLGRLLLSRSRLCPSLAVCVCVYVCALPMNRSRTQATKKVFQQENNELTRPVSRLRRHRDLRFRRNFSESLRLDNNQVSSAKLLKRDQEKENVNAYLPRRRKHSFVFSIASRLISRSAHSVSLSFSRFSDDFRVNRPLTSVLEIISRAARPSSIWLASEGASLRPRL